MRAPSYLVWAASLLLLVVFTVCVHGDPREVENAEFQEEFGETFDDAHSVRVSDVDTRIKFELEHNIPSDASASGFSKRGNVEVVFTSSAVKPKVTFTSVPTLSSMEIEYLEKLLKENRHYTVRARSNPADPNSEYVMTSIPMCMLAGTRMREDFALHISDSGELIAIEYLTPYISPQACAEYQKRDLKNVKFGPFGNVFKTQNGPSPPKQIDPKRDRAPQGVKPVKGDDEPASEEENQSFLRKYWYIVLPIVVFSLFGSDPGPQGGAGAANGGNAPAAGSGGARRR